jgi:hypothetical protein
MVFSVANGVGKPLGHSEMKIKFNGVRMMALGSERG